MPFTTTGANPEAIIVIAAIIFISIMLMALFVGVTIAGGKSHDRANEAAKRQASNSGDPPPSDERQDNGRV